MKGNMRVHYDQKGDFLEIAVGEPTECYAEEIQPGIFIRKDEDTNEVKSISIHSFKKRSESLKDIILNIPIHINFSSIDSSKAGV